MCDSLITPNSQRGLVSILISTGHDKDKGNVLGQLAEIQAKWKGEKEVGRSLFKHPLETFPVSLLRARHHSSEDERQKKKKKMKDTVPFFRG